MKLINNKKGMYITIIIIGAALIIAGALLNIFKGEELKSLSGVCIGLGAVLVSLFSGKLYVYRIGLKHPEIQRKKDIEVNDERNTIIRDKAGAKANNIFVWLIFAAVMVFILFDVELYISLVLAVLIVINSVLSSVYYYYYNKRL